MKEELYAIINGKSMKLDIPNPSGIILNFKSNLFNDISKITCSHSYTFKLPLTKMNKKIFELAEDIRSNSSMIRKKLQAMYLRNGIVLFHNANLYIDGVDTELKAILTWDVLDGLQTLKDNDVSLRKLEGFGVCEYAKKDQNVEEYSNEADVLYPDYMAGLNYTSRSNFSWCTPLPVVPIYRIIEAINSRFKTQFKLGVPFSFKDWTDKAGNYEYNGCNDLLNMGVVPLVKRDMTTEMTDARTIRMESPLIKDIKGEKNGADSRLTDEDISNVIMFRGAISEDAESIAAVKQSNNYNVGATTKSTFTGLKLDGYLKIKFKTRPSEWNVKVMAHTYGDFKDDPGSDDTNEIEVETLEQVSTAYNSGEYLIDFRTAEGYDSIDLDILNFGTKFGDITHAPAETQFIYFKFDGKVEEVDSIEGEVKFVPYYKDDMVMPSHHIDIASNLPDVSCLTFMKSLFYMIGAFPKVNEDKSITPIYYRDIRNNLRDGKCINWSKKVIGNIYNLPNETSYTISGFCQRNYYLNKYDDLNRTKEDKDEERDVYEEAMGCLYVDNTTLNREATIIQIPFYGPYILNKDYPHRATGNTMKCWSTDSKAAKISTNRALSVLLSDLKFTEAKPCVGYLMTEEITTVTNKRTSSTSTSSSSGRGGSSSRGSYASTSPTQSTPSAPAEVVGTGEYRLKMFVWNGFKEITKDESFDYFQDIVRKPYVIKEKLLLTEKDLTDVDYAVPVYIDKYNSYFAIVSIQVSKDDVCTCELLRLPPLKQITA